MPEDDEMQLPLRRRSSAKEEDAPTEKQAASEASASAEIDPDDHPDGVWERIVESNVDHYEERPLAQAQAELQEFLAQAGGRPSPSESVEEGVAAMEDATYQPAYIGPKY